MKHIHITHNTQHKNHKKYIRNTYIYFYNYDNEVDIYDVCIFYI